MDRSPQAGTASCKYYHVVFTLPHQLNAVILGHRKILFKLLFEASAQTLLTFAKDEKYLGATPGIISVLHIPIRYAIGTGYGGSS